MVNIGAIFGRGGNRNQEQQNQEEQESHSSSSQSTRQEGGATVKESTQDSSSKSSSVQVTQSDAQAVGLSQGQVEKVAAFGHKEDGIFEKARKAQQEAEEAAKVASANAEKSFRLISVSESTKKEVHELREHHESVKGKIEDTNIADIEAKAKKDELADIQGEIKSKGQIFDEARNEARALARQVQEKSNELESKKGALGDLKDNLGKANQTADHYRDHLKKYEAQKPDLDSGVKSAYEIVQTNGQDVDKLQAQLNDAEKLAADLERQAREAREKANAKKTELDNAQKKKTTIVETHEKKRGEVAELDKKIADVKSKLSAQENSINDISGQKSAKQTDVDKLIAELEKLQKLAKEKDDEARAKRKAYDEVDARKEKLEREAKDAAAAQSDALKTRATLQKELQDFASRLEKTETKLAVSAEEAKQALETAKSSDARKHKLLEIARKYQQEADDLTHKKITTAEDVLSEKLSELTEISKEIFHQKETTSSSSSKTQVSSGVHVNNEGPATPDLTKQTQSDAEQAKTAASKSINNGSSSHSQSSSKQQASQAASDTKGKVEQTASQAKDKADNTLDSVKKNAQEARDAVSKKTSN